MKKLIFVMCIAAGHCSSCLAMTADQQKTECEYEQSILNSAVTFRLANSNNVPDREVELFVVRVSSGSHPKNTEINQSRLESFASLAAQFGKSASYDRMVELSTKRDLHGSFYRACMKGGPEMMANPILNFH